MKKILLTIFLFVLALSLVACGGNNSNDSMDVAGAKKIYEDTMKAYGSGKGVDAKVTYNYGTQTSSIQFAYNLEGNNIKDLAYVVNNELGELSVYVKDGVAYMNAYGTKTKTNMTDADNATFVEKYTFAKAVEEINVLFGYTFFGAAKVESATEGKVKLSCDLSLLQADPSLDEDAFFEAEENIEKLQAKKALAVDFEYSGSNMSKFVGTVTETDDTVKTFTVEFKGTAPTITLPDVSGYDEVE